MGDAAEQKGAHGDMDHGLGHIEALFVIADEAAPADHPAEGALHNSTSRDDLDASRLVGAADDLDHEVEEGGLVHELRAVVARVGEEMREPRPALANGVHDRLRSSPSANANGSRSMDASIAL